MEVLIINAGGVEVESREEPDDFNIENVADFLGMLGYVDEATFEVDPFEYDGYGGYESAKIVALEEKKDRTYYLDYDRTGYRPVPGEDPKKWILRSEEKIK